MISHGKIRPFNINENILIIIYYNLLFFYSPEKIGKLTEQMVGYNLTTKQTPPEGVLVKKVLK